MIIDDLCSRSHVVLGTCETFWNKESDAKCGLETASSRQPQSSGRHSSASKDHGQFAPGTLPQSTVHDPILCEYMYMIYMIYMIEGSLEVKLPTIWTDEKQSREEAERRERLQERRVRRKKMQMREKVGKSRNALRFSNDLRLRRVEK